ncbi:MAG: DUF1549 and DUF1553 domain-containing protein [Planctomycetota bacterium]|nr:DUF1549 and DUF1553 domain-containing protein [Planctomycetota bacterium]
MRILSLGRLTLCLLAVGAGLSTAVVFADERDANDPVAVLATLIDQRIDERIAAEKGVAAPPADDGEFLRRVYLDIAGKTPTVADLRDFLADESPDKRRKVVEELLDGPSYITNFAHFWRSVMIPEADSNPEVRFLLPAFEAWLRQRIKDNVPYDKLVREILEMTVDPRQAANPFEPQSGVNALSFYQAKQLKPENLAASTARMFLGIRIECAQCHDHPFDEWKQEQFWGYAAFFAGLNREQGGVQGLVNSILETLGPTQLEIPGKNKKVTPTYFDGTAAQLGFRDSPRRILADWMVGPDNPYFTRTLANRLWGHFFGLGIVHPIDDFTLENPPSHSELLDDLAKGFASQGHDVKFLIRAITSTKAYQRSSRQTDPSQENGRLFSKMALKGLTPEQIFDSIAQATGFFEQFANRNPMMMDGNSPRAEFLQTFENSRDSVTETQTTILQALSMMNGKFVEDATSLDNSATLSAVIEFPLMTNADRIETLYLAALGRPPSVDELRRMEDYVKTGGPTGDWKRALGDIFWALLNSSEFLFNR